jgi:hypothetical protein
MINTVLLAVIAGMMIGKLELRLGVLRVYRVGLSSESA